MGSSMQRRVFDQLTDAFNRHDLEAFKAGFAPDVTCAAPGDVRLQGAASVAAYYQSWMDGFPDGRVELREVHEIDGGFVEEGTFSGQHRGVLRTPGGDIPATGRTLNARYVQVVRMRGEQVTSFDLFYDRLELLEQLGLVDAASAGDSRTRDDTASMMPM